MIAFFATLIPNFIAMPPNKTTVLAVWLSITGILCGYTACTNQVSGIKNVASSPLTDRQLMLILADLHTAQAIEQMTHAKDTLLPNTLSEYYAQVLCMHQVSAEDFEQSFNYYAARPEELDKIYNNIQSQYNYIDNLLKERAAKELPATISSTPLPQLPKLKSTLSDDTSKHKRFKGFTISKLQENDK